MLLVAVIAVAGLGGYLLFLEDGEESGLENDDDRQPLEPASFSLSDLNVSPGEVESGERVTVSVRVSNTGEEAGDHTLELLVNGDVEDSDTVFLEGGEEETVEFEVSRESEGEHSVAIGDLSGAFVVKSAIFRIRVEGNRFVAEGEPITLRGASIADPYHIDTVDDYYSREVFEELRDWNANVVRVPVHPGYWKDEPDYAEKYLDSAVSWGKDLGLYVIIDWHVIGNPLTGEAQATDWYQGDNPPVYDPSVELAENFWMDISKRYSEEEHVIFEIFNEPASLTGSRSWTSLSEEFNSIIDGVRTNAPETLVLVSGWGWTSDLVGYGSYPIEDNNIAYVGHYYPPLGSWESYDSNFGFLGEENPLIVTEWGYSTTDREAHYYGSREKFGKEFLMYMENRNISWVAWCFHPEYGPRMLEDWDYELTDWGTFAKQALAEDDKPPSVSIESPAPGESLDWDVEVEGSADDETGLLDVLISIDGGPYVSVEHGFDSEYRKSDWAYNWETNLYEDGEHTINVRALDTSYNSTVVSETYEVDNPEDDDPPSVGIEAPPDGGEVEGLVEVSGTAVDELTGVRNVEVSVDGVDHTAWVSDGGDEGVFSRTSFENGEWLLVWDTRTVSDGEHELVVSATDEVGNRTEESINVQVSNGNSICKFESSDLWSTYSGGASIEANTGEGLEGNALKVNYQGTATGYWGINKGYYRDFTEYEGIKFQMKGDPNVIRLVITDSGNEQWAYKLDPTEEWEEVSIPFDDFSMRADWQPDDAEEDEEFDLESVRDVQIMQSLEDQDADGVFWLDEMELY